MEFNTWLRRQTGLLLYDFRVLDDGTSEEELRELFDEWKKTARPEEIKRAVESAADEGFEVSA